MRTFASLLLATALLATTAMTPVFADDWHGRGEEHDRGFEGHERGGEGRGEWHGDIHRFHEHDFDRWHGGHWLHEIHEGRDCWWWIVDGLWYFYPSPIYPFPDPYTPPEVVLAPAPVGPAGPPSYVYYCANPSGYYPYVGRCFTAWQRMVTGVTVAPPQPAPVLDQRQLDGHQLNSYTASFQKTNLNDPHARSRLRSLEKKVAAFRQQLYTRTYNAMDILRDADLLEHRIAEQRERLPH